MRETERVTGRARCRNRRGRAAGALGVGRGGILPEAERHPDGTAPRAEQRHGAVDAAAHRDGDAGRGRLCPEHLRERARERLDGERLTADGSGFEERQADDGALEPGCIRGGDPLPVDRESDRGPGIASRRVPEDLGAHRARLAATPRAHPA